MSGNGFLLDTNVISELAKPAPDAALVQWISPVPATSLFLSAISLGEIARGIYRLPSGRKRGALRAWFDGDLQARFKGRVLAYDQPCAVLWGEITGTADRRGRPRAIIDAQIAATARCHDLTIVTRNTADFAETGVAVFDPWKQTSPL